jgi:putative ABC transport system permease protein
MRVDNGYTADRVLIASVELPRGATEARTDQFIEAALARLRARRDVSAAGAGAMIPLMIRTAIAPFTLPDSVAGGKPTHGRALVYWITPGYAEALGLRLREGRFFADADARAGTLATIVNEEFVRQHLGARPVTGLRIPNLLGQEQGVTAEIVGVVGNVLKDGNDRQPQPELYFVHGSHGQRISELVHLVIRTTGNPAALAQDVRGLVRQIDREAVVDRIEPLTTAVAASLDAPRFAASVVSGFASVAILLAVVGLYGVLSYSVSQRVRELAIRAALGAQRADLVSLVLREGLSVTVAGIVLGLLGARLFTGLMQGMLFGVTPLDAAAFTAAPAVLVVASLVACIGPAWRAASTDPATTLRG